MAENTKEQTIDESLYSRQLYVLGHEAQKRMAEASVLLAGVNALGVEVAKNIILAGVKSVTLFDSKNTTFEDLAGQFYLNESNIGENRAVASVSKLADLNPYVKVSVAPLNASLEQTIKDNHYTVVVLIDQTLDTQSSVAKICRENNSAFITGDIRGVFGNIFCDFGDQFVVNDIDGEPAASSIVAGITKDFPALVSVLEETRHNLKTGDVVKITGVGGMHEVNGLEVSVTVKDPFTFEIDHDTRTYSNYERGGYINQIKQPTTINFQPFDHAFYRPGMFVTDDFKGHRVPMLHLIFRALQLFQSAHDNQLPSPGNVADADEVVKLVYQLQGDFESRAASDAEVMKVSKDDVREHEEFIRRVSYCARGVISPMAAILGGVLGQEVIKACSSKFMPIKQWFYYDAFEALPEKPLPAEEVQPMGCRYDGQIMVFGKSIQERLGQLNMFLVGAGAIGCEMLKNWAMMGIACKDSTQQHGMIHVTDMDQIEKSNLSRQFLFRNTDINKMKSTTALDAVRNTMNRHFHGRSYEHKVAEDTEHIFNDDFYESLDMICTALDNVEARLYLDQKCLFYQKPMLESGTLGAKGHTQIVAPFKTENYGATRDPPEKSIPVCTLKHFPNQIEHTLQWAREWFEEIYQQAPADALQYLSQPTAYLNQLNQQHNVRLETLRRIHSLIEDGHRPKNIVDCIIWARKTFEELFANRIKQLLHNFPLDFVTSSGTPFWSGAKKPPTPIDFNFEDPLHVEFIAATANLRASIFQLQTSDDLQFIAQQANNVVVEKFRPVDGVKIAATEEEMKAEQENNQRKGLGSQTDASTAAASSMTDIDELCQSLVRALPGAESLGQSFQLRAIDFDKDIDAHMRVIAAASNLRARNYMIPEADLHTSRGIAGKITPAIATTTALVTGAICLEIYKLLQDKPADALANTFANLAIPLFTSMVPEPPKSTTAVVKGREWKWTPWDRIDISRKDMTVNDLISYLNKEYGFDLSMLSSGVTILYSDFMDRKKVQERKNMTLKTLVETVTKKPIDAKQKFLIFEIIVVDSESGDEVEVPYLRYRL